MQVIEAGDGKAGDGPPVVALADRAFAASAGCARLARRFRMVVLVEASAPEAAAWIAAQGLDSLGLIAVAGHAPAGLEVACAAPQVAALVLVSPAGVLTDDAAARERMQAAQAPKCVLVGGADADQPADALARYRTELGAAGVVLVYDAGADIAAERPAAFAAAAGDFLAHPTRFGFAAHSLALAD